MENSRTDLSNATENLADAATDAAHEKVEQARSRLADAMDAARETYNRVQDKAIQGAKATDKAIRENPYQALGIAFGVGALLGFLLSRRNRD